MKIVHLDLTASELEVLRRTKESVWRIIVDDLMKVHFHEKQLCECDLCETRRALTTAAWNAEKMLARHDAERELLAQVARAEAEGMVAA